MEGVVIIKLLNTDRFFGFGIIKENMHCPIQVIKI